MTNEIKIFIGFLETWEIKNSLNKNSLWKQALLDPLFELRNIENQQKNYIGKFIPQGLTLKELQNEEEEIRKKLQLYCPQINLEHHRCNFFSQTFIS